MILTESFKLKEERVVRTKTFFTHIIVDSVTLGEPPLWRRVIDFVFRRKRAFVMPYLQFNSIDGEGKSPLINLEQAYLFEGRPIELPFPIADTDFTANIVNPNDYPVFIKIRFYGTVLEKR